MKEKRKKTTKKKQKCGARKLYDFDNDLKKINRKGTFSIFF